MRRHTPSHIPRVVPYRFTASSIYSEHVGT
jgi:hypothetical protein